MSYKILIVDDEPANLRLLERLFRRQYQIVVATSGAEALELLRMHDAAVIISDQRMPGMTGIEFLKRAAEMRPHTVRIVLTGYTDVNALVEAINSGVVYKYVSKPWVNEDLQQTTVRAIEHYETIKNQYQLKLQNERLSAQLESAKRGLVRFVAAALDSEDPGLLEHLRRTSNYAVAVGYRLDLEPAELEQLALAGFLHESGRILAPEATTGETAAIDAERRTVTTGAQRAARLLANFPGLEEVAAAVRYCGELFDNNSSDNLSGEQIPLFARIVAVANAYDEVTVPQDAEALTHEEAVAVLQSQAGKRFDPRVVETLGGLESISRIRQEIAKGGAGMNFLSSCFPCDASDLSTAELLQKFKTEPILALEVLRSANAANSASTAKLMPAMSVLGEDKLRSIIVERGLPTTEDRTTLSASRGVRRAVAAQMLTAHTDIVHPEEAYALGLLYDIGEILLLNLFPDEMLALEEFEGAARLRRQVEFFGMDAAQISRRMLEVCGVPASLAAATENRQNSMSIENPSALLLHIADVLATTETGNKTIALGAITAEMLEVLHLSRADLYKIYERVSFISEEHVEAPEKNLELAY